MSAADGPSRLFGHVTKHPTPKKKHRSKNATEGILFLLQKRVLGHAEKKSTTRGNSSSMFMLSQDERSTLFKPKQAKLVNALTYNMMQPMRKTTSQRPSNFSKKKGDMSVKNKTHHESINSMNTHVHMKTLALYNDQEITEEGKL